MKGRKKFRGLGLRRNNSTYFVEICVPPPCMGCPPPHQGVYRFVKGLGGGVKDSMRPKKSFKGGGTGAGEILETPPGTTFPQNCMEVRKNIGQIFKKDY